MARRSLRHQVASTSTTPKKRAASPETPTSTKLPRRSKPSGSSAASQKVTAKKSRYFTKGSDEDELAESASEDSQDAASNYEATDDVASASADGEDEDEDEDEDEYESDADSKPKKRGRPKQTNGMVRVVGAKGQEMWRTGVKTGLDPGQEVYIELPKARKPGKTPYKDETIHPNTFLFLKDLANNNDREWLKMHDADYRAAQKDWNSFVEKLTEQVIEKDDTIPELPVKDIVFRIYRDIRFSPDPTPYKTYFSAAWSRTGRKGPYAGYYVQIQPGGTFVGGGLWMPEAQALASLRRDVDRKSHKIKSVLTNAGLRKEFFGGIPKNEKNAVRAFIGQNTENALKTKPKVNLPNLSVSLKPLSAKLFIADASVSSSSLQSHPTPQGDGRQFTLQSLSN
ncbi:MAG: hypothetical protein M1819_004183 [Sarea resinae]|nr:MAG: hypothetical protein M1819_004183 [Sarea resinae]